MSAISCICYIIFYFAVGVFVFNEFAKIIWEWHCRKWEYAYYVIAATADDHGLGIYPVRLRSNHKITENDFDVFQDKLRANIGNEDAVITNLIYLGRVRPKKSQNGKVKLHKLA